jgi:hypothetical protein
MFSMRKAASCFKELFKAHLIDSNDVQQLETSLEHLTDFYVHARVFTPFQGQDLVTKLRSVWIYRPAFTHVSMEIPPPSPLSLPAPNRPLTSTYKEHNRRPTSDLRLTPFPASQTASKAASTDGNPVELDPPPLSHAPESPKEEPVGETVSLSEFFGQDSEFSFNFPPVDPNSAKSIATLCYNLIKTLRDKGKPTARLSSRNALFSDFAFLRPNEPGYSCQRDWLC